MNKNPQTVETVHTHTHTHTHHIFMEMYVKE